MGRRDELLVAEERGWEELNDLIGGRSNEELQTPGVTPDGWSIKDVMWHVACWSADCVRALEQMRAGTFAGATIQEDTDAVNRRWFELSRRLDLETVKAEWYASRTLMIERFAGLDPLAALAGEADEWFAETGPLHYAKHLDDLRVWLAGRARQP
jgi:hypothetical protein